MHLVVSWDISAVGERRTTIDEALKAVLKPYSWVRPLTTYYVVKVAAEYERSTIRDGLTSVAKTYPNDVHYVISPVMTGRYDGWLPVDTWPKVNLRTD